MSSVYCVKCRKLGLIACVCVALAMSAAGAPTDGPASAHAVSAIGIGATGTTSANPTSISTIFGPVAVIHDENTGTPRLSVWQDRQRGRAQAATPLEKGAEKAGE
jgi:hypothetical protein